MCDFLEDNAPKAYTLEEIADETEVIMASSSGGQISMSSTEQGLAQAIGRVYLELLAEPLVEGSNLERHADSSGVEYYRYSAE